MQAEVSGAPSPITPTATADAQAAKPVEETLLISLDLFFDTRMHIYTCMRTCVRCLSTE